MLVMVMPLFFRIVRSEEEQKQPERWEHAEEQFVLRIEVVTSSTVLLLCDEDWGCGVMLEDGDAKDSIQEEDQQSRAAWPEE